MQFINKVSEQGSLFLLLPIPKQGVSLSSNFFLTDNNAPIKASFKVLNTWPSVKNEQFIRLLSIEVNALQFPSKAQVPSKLTLSWVNSDKALSVQQINTIESQCKLSLFTLQSRG